MSEERLVPKLRFNGFTDEWETKKLCDISTINPKTKDLPNEFIYIDLDSVENGILTKKNNIGVENAPSRAQRLLDVGDILFQTVRPYQMNNLYFDLDDDNYVASTGYAQIKSKINSKFLYHYLYYSKFVHDVLKRCTGTSYPAINATDLKNIKIKMPSNIDEQMNISYIFDKLDLKIGLLEKKYKYYIGFKKYLMQQIFAQRLRFEIVKGGYEEYLISDLFDSKKGSGLSKKDIVDDGSNKCILYGELYTIYSEIIDEVQSRTNSECSCLSKKGDILIPTSTTTNGIDLVTASVIFENNVYLGGDITILRNKDESIVNNSYFAYYFSNGLIEEVSRLTQGSTIIHLYWKDFKKVKVKIPSVAEQEKITSMFQFLDKKLGNIGYAVESMREFKKGLLQQMFI